MSDYLNGLARRARLGNPYRKLLLLFLTDRADDQTGITAPASISYIAFGTELSETTVKKYRKELGPADGSEEEEDVRLGLISWDGSSGRDGWTFEKSSARPQVHARLIMSRTAAPSLGNDTPPNSPGATPMVRCWNLQQWQRSNLRSC